MKGRTKGRKRDYYILYINYKFTDQCHMYSYQIIVADAADAVSVNFSGRCKFLQI